MMETTDIFARFSSRGLSNTEKAKEMSHIVVAFRDIAEKLNKKIPDSREKTIAMERLEESFMWFNIAITNEEF